jgi:2-polyprenyl-6-methoxyphenol hydroxylase-like FAD-dependent oxidoreductase
MKEIHIVGGGLAGLTLGIGLRRQRVAVTIHEAGSYPRHRVCGEFISGRGIESLRRLGLIELLERCGARWATSAAFFSGDRECCSRQLPDAALCISRFGLDSLLAERFRELDGELRCRERWTQRWDAEGMVRATGRRASGDQHRWRWFGLKAHAGNVSLSADLELHFTNRGYVGLCRLAGDAVNVCGLFCRKALEPALPKFLPNFFLEQGGQALRARLQNAKWDNASTCSVAGLSFRDPIAREPDHCRLGDTMAVIPPFTGNGMSIAFESAEMAVSPLTEYASGQRGWTETRKMINATNRRLFVRRIQRAGWLHSVMLQPTLRRVLFPVVAHCQWPWQLCFRITRQ